MESYMDYRALGSALQSARIAAGYSQKDVAGWFGKTYQNISSWERGISKIDIDSLLVLCDKYGIDFVTVLKTVSKAKPAANEGDGLSVIADRLSDEAKEVAESYENADSYVRFGVRKLLGLNTQNMEFQFAARKSDTPHPSTGPDTDVQI